MAYKNTVRVLLLLLIVAVVASFFIFDALRFINLSAIKAQQQQWKAYYHQHPLPTLLIFFVVYLAVTAFSLPAATLLTVVSGALFGMGVGLVMVSFASTLGASLAFLMARFLVKAPVQARYHRSLEKINEGFRREGAFYLFALRLVPLFPFFVINLTMAVLPIKLWTFFWVSQLGMLPGTAVYVYAGTQLGNIESLSDVTSPSLLFAFALVGLFPLAVKKLLRAIRKTQQ